MFKCWLKKFGTVWAWIILSCALFAEAAWIFTAISLLLWDTPEGGFFLFFGVAIPTGVGFMCYVECNDARKRAIADAEDERERAAREVEHQATLADIRAGRYV